MVMHAAIRHPAKASSATRPPVLLTQTPAETWWDSIPPRVRTAGPPHRVRRSHWRVHPRSLGRIHRSLEWHADTSVGIRLLNATVRSLANPATGGAMNAPFSAAGALNGAFIAVGRGLADHRIQVQRPPGAMPCAEDAFNRNRPSARKVGFPVASTSD